MNTYRLTTAKGTHTGSLASCIAEQRELQGAFAEIALMRGDVAVAEVSVDDDHIDWSDDDDGVLSQIEHAISIEG